MSDNNKQAIKDSGLYPEDIIDDVCNDLEAFLKELDKETKLKSESNKKKLNYLLSQNVDIWQFVS